MASSNNLSQREAVFHQEVITRFELYNSLFLTLPFYQVKDTGNLLPFFSAHCEQGAAALQSPIEIIQTFFKKYTPDIDHKEQLNRLFRFIQYIERQVVLFDAIEDSSFSKTTKLEDTGTLQNLILQTGADDAMRDAVKEKLKNFSLRLVLTAHPTQFYPSRVLGIMTDLIEALKTNDINNIDLLLQQLGKTPFFNKAAPTPVDEATSLIWFLENVFYQALSATQRQLNEAFDTDVLSDELLEMGFWPGGDRDGNPNVRTDSTKTVAALLRQIIFRCYYRDFRLLQRRITFRGVEEPMQSLGKILYDNAFNPTDNAADHQEEMLELLARVKATLVGENYSLFVAIVDDLARKIKLFGCYFATLDIRQDSRILRDVYSYISDKTGTILPANYEDLAENEKLKIITFAEADFICPDDAGEMIKDTLNTIRLVKQIQLQNGEKACNRFIISNCQQASDILQLINLFFNKRLEKRTPYHRFYAAL